MSGLLLTLDEPGAKHLVATDPRLVILEFSGERCLLCRRLAAKLERVVGERQERVVAGVVDIAACETLAHHCRVYGVPTLVLFKNGREVGRKSSDMPYETLVSLVEAQLRG